MAGKDTPSGQADSRFRPRARLRFRIARPARVAIRARNPCLRFRLRTFGWYVRFMRVKEGKEETRAGRKSV
jgi:hypothetical protein